MEKNNLSKIDVCIVYALPDIQYIYKIFLKTGSTVKNAIDISEILHIHKNIDFKNNKIGIFGKFVQLYDYIYNGDRIEIYRPLIIDSKNFRFSKIKKHRN